MNNSLNNDQADSITFQIHTEKKLMLIYNVLQNEELILKSKDIPADWSITTDRRCFPQADAVVFHLPDLLREMENDVEQSPGQLWVAWYLESEKNYPGFRSPEIRETFDLWMSYRQDADVVYPFYRYEYTDIFTRKIFAGHKRNKCCISVSDRINKSAGHMLYLKELMKHTGIDSYGRLFNNQNPPTDRSAETKTAIYRGYKFVIAFEDAHDTDYVTEKFFEPLIAGSVPVYLGAPNINDFAPGDHCFVDVRQFESPRRLAHFINNCYQDDQLYAKFFEWKNQPLRPSFLQKAEMQKEHPFVRLCRMVDEKRLSRKNANDADDVNIRK